MKKTKRNCDFASERSESLIKNFSEALKRQSQISIHRALKEAAEAPAPRFWVSEARAMRIVSMMMKGHNVLDGMHTEKRKMYKEIYERVMKMKEENPETPFGDIVFEVVNSPAPSSYLTAAYARKLIVFRD